MGTNHLIDMSGITVSFPQADGTRRTILNNVGLKVKSGEFVVIVGPSGCGKSTLCRLILGSDRPTEGVVTVDGNVVDRVRRDVGMVYQKYSLFPHLTVLENVTLGLIIEHTNLPQRISHTPKYWRVRGTARKEAKKILLQMGFSEGDFGKHPDELSGGMQQRVAIAQAIAMKPKVLLMDEPFSGLDAATRESMQLLILNAWQEFGMTVVFVTHDLKEGLFLGTRVIALSQYWVEDDLQQGTGAQIVCDWAIPSMKPTGWKFSSEFNGLAKRLHEYALDKNSRLRRDQFDLTHADASLSVETLVSGSEGGERVNTNGSK